MSFLIFLHLITILDVTKHFYAWLHLSYYIKMTVENITHTTTQEKAEYTYNSDNRLSAIEAGSTEYTFTYDAFGNTSKIKAGDNQLAQYVYNNYNGNFNIEIAARVLET